MGRTATFGRVRGRKRSSIVLVRSFARTSIHASFRSIVLVVLAAAFALHVHGIIAQFQIRVEHGLRGTHERVENVVGAAVEARAIVRIHCEVQ